MFFSKVTVLLWVHLVLLLLLSPAYLQARQIQDDSLQDALRLASTDSARIVALQRLINVHFGHNQLAYQEYYQELLSLARKTNDRYAEANLYREVALLYFDTERDSALAYFEKALPLLQQISKPGIKQEIADVYNRIGLLYKNLTLYDSASQYLGQALQFYQQLRDTTGLANALNNIGVIFTRKGDNVKAVEYYLRSLKLREAINDVAGAANSHGSLGNLYKEEGDYEKALESYRAALSAFEELDRQFAIGIIKYNIGSVLNDLSEYDSAYRYYLASREVFVRENFLPGLANVENALGVFFIDQGQSDSAIIHMTNALSLFLELGDLSAAGDNYRNIANQHIGNRQYQAAERSLNKSLELARESGESLALMDSYELMASLYEYRGDPTEALAYYKLYDAMKDTLRATERQELMADLQLQYDTEKREARYESERKESDRIIKQKEFENRLLIGSVGAVCLLIFYVYRNYRAKSRINSLLSNRNKEVERQQQEIIRINDDLLRSEADLKEANEKLRGLNENLEGTVAARTSALKRTNEELDTFLYQSSHALRRPIVHIKGLVQLANMEEDPAMMKELFDKMFETAESMDLMLHKLMVASEISFDGFTAHKIYFKEIVEDVWKSMTAEKQSAVIPLDLTVTELPDYFADPVLIRTIFENLLENSIAYLISSKKQDPIIKISITREGESIHIKIYDNGPGISQESQEQVFKMFMVAHDHAKGYGLGLYIVQKAVEKLSGSITVLSEPEHFTEFQIILPHQITSTVQVVS